MEILHQFMKTPLYSNVSDRRAHMRPEEIIAAYRLDRMSA